MFSRRSEARAQSQSAFRNRVSLTAAGPDLEIGKLAGQHVGKTHHSEALAGEMAGQEQGNAESFGFQTSVKSGLAHQHRVATVLPGGVEQFAGRAAGHRDRANGFVGLADQLQPVDREKPLEPLGKLPKQKRFGEPSPAASALTFGVRRKRRDAAQFETGRQTLVDPLAGRVERRVR